MALNIKSLLCEEHEMEKKFFKRDHCLRDYRLFNSEECAYNNELEPIQLFDVPVVKEMVPEYTKEQFLRKAWIDLAKKDVPLDVFSENFSEIVVKKHDVFVNAFSANFSYQASIGYDHEEPYNDYESYFVNEPYLSTESYYDANTKTTQMRQVTEYRKVEKQRVVTKSRIVTGDWQPFHGEKKFESAIIKSAKKDSGFNYWLFLDNLENAKPECAALPFSDEQNVNNEISKEDQKDIKSRHCVVIYNKILSSLPGDEARDIDFLANDIVEKETALYKIPEYKMSIQYGGKEYSRYTYPFGEMKTEGDKIENINNFSTIRKNMEENSEKRKKEREEATKKRIEDRTLRFSMLTIFALLLSIVLSWFVQNFIVINLAFIVAVIVFVVDSKKVKSAIKEEKDKTYNDICEESTRAKEEISDFIRNYRARVLSTLNNKLQSLGLECASENDILDERNGEWIASDDPKLFDTDSLNSRLC